MTILKTLCRTEQNESQPFATLLLIGRWFVMFRSVEGHAATWEPQQYVVKVTNEKVALQQSLVSLRSGCQKFHARMLVGI